ncbi:MAG: Gmad2 immunoglobulin-like domain-containing protein [Bacteroidia bacterium]|nr:Gmad2 immunoglobulin-like domain-containing protein [Bacteroidia bacterium]MCX7763902.1 Gmad2 immunoglobulin-like domain-containing protein [Bacteroidia bacterium]MDW8057684.1 hypothetical protein [Bacteroidia bacterium]
MRLLMVVLALSLLWAQEESRARGETPAPRPTAPRHVVTRPAPREEVVVMETISGKIVSKQGAGMSGVHLQILDKQTGKVLSETHTDAHGNFAVVVSASTHALILRLNHEGKSLEKEYELKALTQGDTEIVFDP